MLKIEFDDQKVELVYHCIEVLENAGADIIAAAKELTEDGQRILVYKNKDVQIKLERVDDGKYRFILKQDMNINFTFSSAVFKLRDN